MSPPSKNSLAVHFAKEKRKIKSLLWIIALAFSFLLSGCDVSDSANKGDANTPRTANANANVSASPDLSAGDADFEVPDAKPLKNGKTQTYYDVTFTVPANWKKIKFEENPAVEWGVAFQSPGSEAELLKLTVFGAYLLDDLNYYFTEMRRKPDVFGKVRMLTINGENGILRLDEDFGDEEKHGGLTWETFLPRDSTGKFFNRRFIITFPSKTYEQHKDEMFAILYSVKIKPR